MQELVFVAHFEELVAAALIIIKYGLELWDPLLALPAYPVTHLLMWAVGDASILH